MTAEADMPPSWTTLVSQDVAGWIVGLAVGLTSLILAAVLWSLRQL